MDDTFTVTVTVGYYVNYDSDGDQLIEIDSLVKLNAMRWDTAGNGIPDDPTNGAAGYAAGFPNIFPRGCIPDVCRGYELTADLNFDSDSDGDVDVSDHAGAYWNNGAGWDPIGPQGEAVTMDEFKGNGHVIRNLFINRGAEDFIGLFGYVGPNVDLLGVGLEDPNVKGRNQTGALAGRLEGRMTYAFVEGGSVEGSNYVGGLVGWLTSPPDVLPSEPKTRLAASYASASVLGLNLVGGLVGIANNGAVIVASYAAGTATCNCTGVSGLVGAAHETVIVASYSLSGVDGGGDGQGLVANSESDNTVTDSYWNTLTSGKRDTGAANVGWGKTTAELRTPTDYAGIYADWDVDLDNGDDDDDFQTGVDNPWDFGTAGQYPVLKVDFNSDGDATINEFGRQRRAAAPNRAPVFTEGASAARRVKTATATGTDFGAPIAARDPDGDTLVYALGGTDAAHFAIDSSSGQLSTDGALDMSAKNSYTVTVSVHDGLNAGGNADTTVDATITVTINVVTINSPPVFTYGATYDINAVENRTSLGLIPATDPDGDTLTYAIDATTGDHGDFEMDGDTLQFKTAPDFEAQTSYTVVVTVRDSKNAAGGADAAVDASITVTVTVLDVDEPPGPVRGLMAFGKDTAIDVEWTAPDMAGKPPVTNYNVQYRQWVVTNSAGAWGAWQDHVHAGTAVTTTITGLTNGNHYLVGVRADNAEGTSAWRQSVMARTTPPIDYDADNDGLIDAGDHHALYGIRWDLNGDGAADQNADRGMYAYYYPNPVAGMGCPSSACTGYELTDDIDLPHLSDPWEPIGDASAKFSATFDGKGHTISGLRINRPSDTHNGLFGAASSASVIRNVGLLSVDVAGGGYTGALAGLAEGTVESVYVTGTVAGAGDVGGLVGGLAAGGSIARSYAAAAVTGTGDDVGGLAGSTAGGGSVKASYATGAVTGVNNVGGLIGNNGVTVTAAYSTGSGGRLVGANTGTITHSYWDLATSGQADDSDAATGVGKTTLDLKTPTAYGSGSDIYANWNLDLDGDSNTDDDPWDFGSNAMYPAIKTDFNDDGTASAFEFGGQGRSANAAPAFTEGAGPVDRSVPENTETLTDKTFGLPVGATDANTTDTLIYTLDVAGAAHFGIVASSGQLEAKGALDFEGGTTSYQVVVSVADGRDADGNVEASPAVDASITVNISVTNVNEAPVFTPKTQTLTPNENQTAAGIVTAAVDPDASPTLTYQMMTGASDGDHALFTFNATTRALTFKAAPNYEASPTKTSFTVSIRVRDSKDDAGVGDTAWDDTIVVTINLQPVNEKPVFTPKTQTLTPNENQTAAGIVTAAVDPDASPTLTYQMLTTTGDHALFTFVPGTRVLTFKTAPNYEATPTKTSFTVSIRVRDSLNAAGTADTAWDDTVVVTINLQPVNEKPVFTPKTQTLEPPEEQTAAGTVAAAVDPDAGHSLTYQMMTGLSDGDHALFTFVPGTRVLTFKTAPNYEASPTKTSFTVSIRVRDSKDDAGVGDTAWDDTIVVTINLQNVNEAPAFTPKSQTLTPNENQTAAGIVTAAVDPDANPTLTYQMLTTTGDHALFTFNTTTRALTFKAAPNYEASPTKTSFTVSIRVRDSLNAAGVGDTAWDDTIVVTINLQNLNEAPVFTPKTQTLTPNEEQTAAGTVAAAVDPDASPTLTYQMMTGASDGDHALFTFNATTRALTFKAAPNYEASPTKTSFTVSIRVRDSKDDAGVGDTAWDDTIVVTINLQPVNEKPVFTPKTQTLEPPEEQTAAGTVAAAVDPDAGHSLTYQMMTGLSDGDHALFTFVPGTRVLTFKTAPDYEIPPSAKTTYTVKIRVRDSLNAAGTADTAWDDTVVVTINLQPVNELPVFTPKSQTLTPNENQTAAGIVTAAVDPDANPTLTYQMLTTTGDHALFTFNATTRALTFNAAPNFEAKDSYTVSIQVRDSLNAAGTADQGWDDTVVVTINLQDMNEPPEFMSAATTDVDGNPVPPAPIATDTRSFREDAAADAAIGAPVAATDPDTSASPSDTLTYALAASGDHASFAIDTATGQLKTKAGVTYDYEAKDTYTVTVTVHDGKNAADAADAAVDDDIEVTINVTDALERWTPPTNMHIDVVTLANRIRVTWTAPAAVDNADKPDLTGYRVQWRQKRTASAAWAHWADFPRSGLGVTADITMYTVTADDGTTTTHTVATGGGRINEVRVCSLNTDGAKSTDDPKAEQCGSWTGNALPAFTEGTKASRSVAENTAANTNIGLPVAAADSDAGDTLVYSMTVGTHSGKFTIDSATGQLKTKDPLDHETAGSYDVYVKVNDGNNGIDGIMVTITVTDVNEPPAFDDGAGPTGRSVSESAVAEDAIGDPVAATDPDTEADPQDTLTYALDTTTGDHAHFDIDTGTGQLEVKGALDYETKSSYTVTVQVRDSLDDAGAADTAWDDTIVVNISVDDVNEPPAFATNANTAPSVAEGATAVGTYAATDPEGDTPYYGLSGTDSGLLTITSAGVLTLDDPADHETKSSYSVNVRVQDRKNADGDPDTVWDTTLPITVSVTDTLEPPTAPTSVEAFGIANGLRVTWTEPIMTNKPTIEGYDVEYSLRTAVAVGATPATWGAATTSAVVVVEAHEIPGLTPDSTYRVRVRAKNDEGEGTWSSYVNGVPNLPPPDNAVPSFDDGASTTRSVAENTAAGTAIGNPLTATDTDAGDTLVYAIDATTGDHAHFAIDSATGQLKAKGALDYESGTTSYSITVTVSDGNGGTDSIAVTITVTAVNEKPAFPAGTQTLTPNENQTAAGTVTAATDPEGDTLTYRMLPDTGDDDSFNFNTGTRTLTFKTAPDFEAKDTYTVSIQVKDSKNAAGTASLTWDATVVVTVDVQNVSERPSAPTGLGVLAAANGLRVSWTAPDMTGKPAVSGYKLHYSRRDFAAGPRQWGNWVNHAHAGTGTSTTITGLTAGDTYRVQVRAVNADGDGTWTAPDTGVPTAPPVSNAAPVFTDGASTTRSVPENTAAGTAIGNPIAATDADKNVLTYALDAGGDHGHFAIDSASGQLKTKGALDYESGTTSYSITVTVSDGNGGTDSIAVTITVTAVNEKPAFPAGTQTLTPNENQTAAGTVTAATDPEGDTLTYRMLPDTGDDDSFNFNTGTRTLTFKTAPDFEAEDTYTVSIQVKDSKNASGVASLTWDGMVVVTVDVQDVAEAPGDPIGVGVVAIVNGLRVSWTKADATGKPPVGFEVMYQERTSTGPDAWGSLTTIAVGGVTTYDTTGLTPGETYQVQVRARNAEGVTAPSFPIQGVPSAPPVNNAAPAFTDGTSASRNVPENTVAGTNIGAPIAATDGDGDTLVYAIEDPTVGAGAHFGIDSGTGQMKTRGALDYESGTTSYSIRVTVSDGRGGTDSIDVTINVADVNEKPSFDAGASTSFTVTENGGTAVGTVGAADPEDDSLTYALDTTSTDHALFNLNTGTGELTLKSAADFEDKSLYSVSVTVHDGKNAAGGADVTVDATIAITVNVNDVSEPPTAPTGLRVDPAANGLRVSWTAPDMAGKPPITGYDVEHSLRTSAAGASPVTWGAWVDINYAGTGTSAAIAGLTAGETYRAQVRAINAEGDGAWTAPVTGVPNTPSTTNVAPSFDEGVSASRRVAENTPAGRNIESAVGATDHDNDVLSYELEATGDHGHFAIDSSSGQLKTKGALDYESKSSYAVTVIVWDGNGGTDSIPVTIDVTDVVNEPPVVVPPPANRAPSFDEGASAGRSVAENTPAGRNIGLPLAATDPDSDPLTYALGGTDSGHFALAGNQLQTSGALDYESNNPYTVVVTVSDGNGGTDSIDVTITVTNVDDTPVVVALSPGAPWNLVVTPGYSRLGLTWNMPDMTGKPPITHFEVQYKWSIDKYWGDFPHDSTVSRVTIDFLGGGLSYDVRVRAVNSAGYSGWVSVLGIIVDPTTPPRTAAANRAPSFTEGASTGRSVAENTAAGRNIGLPLAATDPDGDSLTYALGGTDSGHFALSGNRLRTSGALDYEGVKSSYSVTVTVSDGRGGTDSIAVTITVTNVDEAPANRAPSFDEGASAGRSVAENTPAGTDIGLPLTATDPDSDPLTYALGGTDSGHFALSGNRLRTSGALDYEGVKNSYSVIVTVSDGRGGTDTIDVTITVTNVNEAPANRAPSFDEGASAGRSVAENTPAGTDIGLPLVATDPDSDSLTYALGGTDSGHFALSGNQLRTSGALDYEGVKSSYSVTVTVSDGNGGTDSIAVTITVTNVDEAPVEPTPQANRAPSFDEGASAGRSVAENAPAGTDIGLPLAATDPDSDLLTYALSGADSGHFALSGNQLRTSGDYEGVKSSYSVTVYVSDGKGGTDSIDVTVTVTNVDEAPVEPTPQANRAPSFDEGANTTRSVAENTEAGQDIGLPLAATDPDDDSLTYALGGTDSGHFALSGNRLQTSGALDYEGQNSYSVTVNVSDGNGGSDTTAVIITVTNVNEPPGALPGLAAFEEVNGIRVSWSAPDMTGKPPITGYDVQYKLVTATDWNDHSHIGTGTGTTIQGLTAGSTYNVRVRAKNDEGNSVWASAQATPTASPVTPVPPGAITNLEVTPGWSKLGLTWNMPDMTGKPPITHYEVQYKLSFEGEGFWFNYPHDSTVRRVTIDFLGGGLSYDVRVRAVNSAGNSDWVSSSGTTK